MYAYNISRSHMRFRSKCIELAMAAVLTSERHTRYAIATFQFYLRTYFQ